LKIEQLGRVLGALRAAGLQADGSLADSSFLGVRVVARNVDGLAGVFAYSPLRHALYEIDTNVGGEIAHAVGAKMQTLGQDHQVICITHLPQVAATASSHFVVTKDIVRGRTFSNLHEVSGKARQEEIARMLGGKSESALKLAASLLKARA